MLVTLARVLQRPQNQGLKIMAKATYSEIISDLRGKIGGHVWSSWKGIPVVKLRPNHSAYAWKSPLLALQRDVVTRSVRRWNGILNSAQRSGWEMYALYLATLQTDYIKLTGWKNYGGTMSGVNAYLLTNSLRASVGLTTFLDEAPNEIASPDQPTLTDFAYITNGPPKLKATAIIPEEFPETSYLRAWCRGTRYAHLILASYAITIGGAGEWDIEYECNEKPDEATPPWALTGTDCAVVSAGILTIDSEGVGGAIYSFYRLSDLTMNNAQGWTIEARMKVITSAALDVRLIIGASDNIWAENLMFSENRIQLQIDGTGYNMDTTDDYHIYRITGKGTTIKVYVDNILRITGTLSNAYGGKYWDIGDQNALDAKNSRSDWDYVHITTAGAYPPLTTMEIEWEQMRYAGGAELGIQPDTYKCQLDIVGASGRFSPPSEILDLIVPD